MKTSDQVITNRRVTRADLPRIRQKLSAEQGHVCPLCSRSLKSVKNTPAVDHCHKTGFIRGVLCLNCNGLEGKLSNTLRRIDITGLGEEELLRRFIAYKSKATTGMIYPSHKTEREKRDLKNKKARAKYAKSKPKPQPKRKTK